jgi:hypothetical protein
MNEDRKRFVAAAVMVFIVLAVAMGACQATTGPSLSGGNSNQSFMHIIARQLSVSGEADLNGPAQVAGPTAIGTATPALIVYNNGVSVPFEVRNSSGTPVAAIGADGAVVFAGSITSAGAVNGGGVLGASLAVAPTTQASATAAFYINSATGNTGALQDWRINNVNVQSMGPSGSLLMPVYVNVGAAATTATPVFKVQSAGAGNVVSVVSAGTPVFRVNAAGNVTSYGVAQFNAESAATTATPAFQINSSGAGNVLSVNAATTPVFRINTAGAISTTGTVNIGLTTHNYVAGSGITPVVASTPVAVSADVMLLSSAGAVDPGGIAAGSSVNGVQCVTFIQTSAQTITFTEAGTLHLGAATRALSQLDSLTICWTGAAWVETAFTDN